MRFLIVLRPMTNEPVLARSRAEVREAEEVEGLRLPLSGCLPLPGRVATEADQPGFRWVQRQFELAQSFLEIAQERLRLMLVLEAEMVSSAYRMTITSPVALRRQRWVHRSNT